MSGIMKNKEKLTAYIVIIALVISVLAVGIGDYRNGADRKHYKMLYDERAFELAETIQEYSIKLKNQVDTVLSAGNISSKDAGIIQNYSQILYFNYMELHAVCINNNYYLKYNDITPRCNLLVPIRNYTGYLDILVNSSSSSGLNITSGSDITKALSLISGICGGINKVYDDYKSGTASETDFKGKMMQSDGWVIILNSIADVFNANIDSADILSKYSHNYIVQD